MARIKPRPRFVLLLLVVVVGVSVFQASTIEETNTVRAVSTERKPNAFATGTQLKEYDVQGKLRMEVKTASSNYFRDERQIETTSPSIRYRNEQGELLELDANQGLYQTETGILLLKESVVLSRTNTEGKRLNIETEDLTIDTVDDFITTEHEVKITQEDHSLSSIGLNASLNDRKLELSNRVRGVYDLSN